MFSVDHPLVLLLLLVVPFGVYVRHFWRGRGGKMRFPFQVFGSRGFRPSIGFYHGIRLVSAFAFWVGFSLLIVAASGPLQIRSERVFLGRGIDIMIVLDESPSMAATDFGGSRRFDGAKRTIDAFVASRPNDAIGLVTFSLDAAVRLPLTTDHSLLRQRLNELSIMDLGDGTAIGDAVGVGALHLQDSDAADQVMVLLSDGVNNAGILDPLDAAEIATGLGIRIYSVGIGTLAETTLDFVNPNTGVRYQALLDEGFDEGLLREIANRTGGAYYHARSERGLAQILDIIDSLETSDRRTRTSVQINPVDRPVLILAGVLLLFDFLVRTLLLREVL